MNITINVDEISLDTAVAEIVSYDEDGDAYAKGERTVADLVAEQIVSSLVKSRDYPGMLDQFREIRAEVIREAVRPQIEEAIAKPIQKTNSYGEKVGEPTTLRELIVEEARKALNAPADKHGYDRQTFIQKTVAEAVKQALAAEIADAVKQARQQVSAEIGQHVASAVAAGFKAK